MSAASTHPERLPWFAAGTLEGAEAAEIARHLEDCPECREEVDVLRSMTRTLRAVAPMGHVAPEHLVAYHEGRVALPDHLRSCPACRADLSALVRADAALHAGGRRRLLGAAASLLVVALAGWQWASWHRPAPVPRTLARVILAPVQRGPGESIPAGPCILRILLPGLVKDGSYTASVRLEGGRALALGTHASHDQWLEISVPRGFPPGHHTLSVTRLGGGDPEVYGYSLEVAPP